MLPALGATNPVALVDGAVVPGALSNGLLVVKNVGAGQHAIWLNTNSAPSSAMLYANRVASSFRTNAANPAVADQRPARPAATRAIKRDLLLANCANALTPAVPESSL